MSTIRELKHYYGGEWKPASRMDYLPVTNPATGETLARVPQALVGIVRYCVLRIPAILGPGQRHMSRAGEAGELIDVPSGLVEIHTLSQPQHGGDPQIAPQLLLDVGAGQLRVAVGVQQALLSRQARPLAVDMNGPSFEHEFGSITIGPFDRQNLLRNLVVEIPRDVESAIQSAPGVEGPIHAAPPPL